MPQSSRVMLTRWASARQRAMSSARAAPAAIATARIIAPRNRIGPPHKTLSEAMQSRRGAAWQAVRSAGPQDLRGRRIAREEGLQRTLTRRKRGRRPVADGPTDWAFASPAAL